MKNRTIAFWITWSLKRLLIMGLVAVAYGFFMGFVNRDETLETAMNLSQLEAIIVGGMPFFAFMLVFFVLILSTNYGEMVFPLSVGFGGTRKDSFAGFQLAMLSMFLIDLVLIVPSIIYYFFITGNDIAFFSSTKGISWCLMLLSGFLAFIFSLAQIGTALYIRTKGESQVWVRFGIAMIGMVTILVPVFLFLNHSDVILGNFVIPSVLLIASCCLYAAGFVWLSKEVRKLEVKL